ncbi:hypothetical protein [Capnocytophaga sp.]|uniref:hypothetical protein n=1 Tax=Capnocytophaga sp. TaxID=44737 RepID=UPI0026DB7C48|nr:hypothetical protein [Capnocytophaga sp.]MDO5105255.1 hypothetical protein [Capnocytophaga sp.]
MTENNNKSYLKLLRFSGEELYPIEKATWHFYEDEDNENENAVWLEIGCESGIQLAEDTKELDQQPYWELTIRKKNLQKSDLTAGFRCETEYDIEESLFQYCECEETEDTSVEILDREGSRILFRIEGEVTDVNYYDGSKPANKIIVEAWFDED